MMLDSEQLENKYKWETEALVKIKYFDNQLRAV